VYPAHVGLQQTFSVHPVSGQAMVSGLEINLSPIVEHLNGTPCDNAQLSLQHKPVQSAPKHLSVDFEGLGG